MRQLSVIAEMGSGGAESVVTQLAAAGAVEGDDLTVATAGGWRVEELERLGAAVLAVPLRETGLRELFGSVRVLRRWLRRAEPIDVVHTHNVRATVAARLALGMSRQRPPIVCTVHGLAERRYPIAARTLTAMADEVVAVSDDVADRLRAGGYPEHRLHVFTNAPTPLERVERATARRALGLAHEATVVLCLARLVRPKRQDLLIEAWRDVPGDALLLVAGDGELRRSLEDQAAGLGDRVRFLGDRHDVNVLLAAADLLVLASDREGLPVTVLEAMSTGVPVVASRVGGLAALDPDSLVLVEPGSASALTDGITALLGDPAMAASVAGRALAMVEASYSGPAMNRRYRELLTSVSRRRA